MDVKVDESWSDGAWVRYGSDKDTWKCFRDFLFLNITQDTAQLDARVQSEPVLDNARFKIPSRHRNKTIATDLKNIWIHSLNLVHMHDPVNDLTDDIITADEMREHCYKYAPNPTSRSTHEWVDELMELWPTLRGALPPNVVDATVDPDPPDPNGYIHLEEQDRNSMYLVTLAVQTKCKQRRCSELPMNRSRLPADDADFRWAWLRRNPLFRATFGQARGSMWHGPSVFREL